MYQVRMVLLSLCMLVICVWSCTHPFSSHKKMRRAWWSRWLSRDARSPSLARAASSLTSPTTPPHATPHTPPSATPHQSPGEPRIIPHTTRATPAPHGALGSVAPHAPLGTPVQRVAPGVNAHHVDDGWPAPILQMMENRFDADAISVSALEPLGGPCDVGLHLRVTSNTYEEAKRRLPGAVSSALGCVLPRLHNGSRLFVASRDTSVG